MKKLIVSAFIIIVVLAFNLPQAEAKDYVWTYVRLDLHLERDGSLWVEETRSLRFWGNFHYAYIEIRKEKLAGIGQVSVWEEGQTYREDYSGAPGTFYLQEETDSTTIRWNFNYSDVERTFHIRYHLQAAAQLGTVSFFSDYDQLYYKAIGAEHERPMQLAEVFVHIPSGAEKDALKLWGYGPQPGSGKVEILDGQTAFLAAAPLYEDVGIEVRLLFPIGLVRQPEGVSRSSSSILEIVQQEQAEAEAVLRRAHLLKDIEYILALLLAVFIPILMFFLWWYKGRELKLPPATAMISGPPSSLAPAGVEVLWYQRASKKGLVATLLDLAHRGYLKMEQQERDYRLTMLKNPGEELKPFEYALLALIFADRSQYTTLSSLSRRLPAFFSSLERRVWAYLKPFRFFEGDPARIRKTYSTLGILFLAAGSLLFGFFEVFVLGTSMIWAAFFIIGFGMVMPKRTMTGARETAAWQAFKHYMQELMKRPALKDATNIFSEYLPYAVVFGLEKAWLDSFAGRAEFSIPIWWVPRISSSGAAFSQSLSRSFSEFYSRVSSALAPQSSGGGGGFSGGGGGGGGGGGSGAG